MPKTGKWACSAALPPLQCPVFCLLGYLCIILNGFPVGELCTIKPPNSSSGGQGNPEGLWELGGTRHVLHIEVHLPTPSITQLPQEN